MLNFRGKSKSEEAGELLMAFVAGAAVGLGVGLLVAPDRGDRTRKKLKTNINDMSEKLREAVEDEMKQVADGMKDVKSAVNQVMRKIHF